MRHFPTITNPRVLAMRELTKADLARLREPRQGMVVKRMKDSHHFLARLFASGMNIQQVCAATGRNYHSTLMLRKSPAFEQLVQEYRGMVTQSWLEQLDGFTEIATANMLRAELAIADKLADYEENPEENKISVRDLMAISRDAADRFGYGKHTTQTNVNVDFAAQLERAIRRSGKGPVIDAEPTRPTEAQGGGTTERGPVLAPPERAGAGDGVSPAPSVIPLPPGFRRRA